MGPYVERQDRQARREPIDAASVRVAGRLPQREQVQAEVIDLQLRGVDLRIGLDHAARQIGVAAQERAHRGGDHLLDRPAEEEELLLQLLQLPLVVAAGVLRHPNLPVM